MSSRFRRYSINLDTASHEKCKTLAHEMSTTVSGIVRLLIRDAFEERHSMTERTSISRSQ